MDDTRRYDVGPGFVRARECPDCGHTKCSEDCVCNCDAAHAEHEAAARKAREEKLEKALEAATADNAALMEIVRRFRNPPLRAEGSSAPFVRHWTATERMADAALAKPHPGAALLRRLETTDITLSAIEEVLVEAGATRGVPLSEMLQEVISKIENSNTALLARLQPEAIMAWEDKAKLFKRDERVRALSGYLLTGEGL